MENITFELSTAHQFGSAYFDYLALRKKFFVDNLGWTIPHNESVEMDQYDNPLARYSLVLKEGRVIAGARAMSTTAHWGDHTYMLRDAQMGKLGTIPKMLDAEIADPKVWECTRLVIADEVKSMRERTTCLALILDGLVQLAEREGAETLISLSNLWLLRVLRKLGYDAALMCDPYVNADDGHKYAVMSIQTMPTLQELPRATHRPQTAAVHAPAV